MNLIRKLIVIFSIAIITSTVNAAQTLPEDDWLRVQGNKIVDANGNQVWLTGANWFGFNTTERVFHGLWSVNLEQTVRTIAEHGINILRVPISTELIWEWRNGQFTVPSVNTAENPDLVGKTSLEIFDRFLELSKQYGLKVLLDVHSAEADNSGHVYPLWYKGEITPEVFYAAWEWIAERYKHDDTILAMDIENEPHGQPWQGSDFAKWDNSTDINNFKYACETASNRILAINPDVLVLCEGIESFPVDGVTWTSNNKDDYYSNWWGGNLRGVRDYPINLGANQDQLVYSPHDYGPLVYLQPWFYPGFNKETLYQDVWKDNWMYIHEEGIAPLLIGEWGGFMDGGDNEKWMRAIRELIIEHELHHTFWCVNPNSGDTGGLLNNDWTTWDQQKYALLLPSLWQDNSNRFVGLDHQVVLGNATVGTNVSQYYAGLEPSVTILSPEENTQIVAGSEFSLSYSSNKVAGVNARVAGGLLVAGPSAGEINLSAPAQPGDFSVQLIAVDDLGRELNVTDDVVLRAVDEIILPAEISIDSPASGTAVTIGDAFEITVSYANAAGFRLDFAGNSQIVLGSNTISLAAPGIAGDYDISVVAIGSDQQPLAAADNISIIVREVPLTQLTCELGRADVWNSGFVYSNIKITNAGDTPLSSWALTLAFDQATEFVNGWNGVFNANGTRIQVSNASYNGTLAPGQSATLGFQGSHAGNFSAPDCITLLDLPPVDPPPVNSPPVASVATDVSAGSAPLRVAFDATGSRDPDNTIADLSFSWTFGDGNTASGAQVSHTYQDPGEYAASLVVSDGQAIDNTSVTITVNASQPPVGNQPPTATATASTTRGSAPLSVNFDASQSSDPDNGPGALTYHWSFGDGAESAAISPAYTFTANGTYEVTLTVSDGEAIDTNSITVVVDDLPLRVDNPFRDVSFYVDPIWSAKAAAEPGGDAIANYNTAVWMDRIGAITAGIGLRGHLDEALDQGAGMFMFVVYNLPNRDCAALASNGELRISENGFQRYREEYIAPIVEILSDPKYSRLQISAIVEVDSLPNLVTNLNVPRLRRS